MSFEPLAKVPSPFSVTSYGDCYLLHQFVLNIATWWTKAFIKALTKICQLHGVVPKHGLVFIFSLFCSSFQCFIY